MGSSFTDKVDAYFVKGAQEHAQELNIMYVQAAKQRAEKEKQNARTAGMNISVEEIVVDNPIEPVLDNNGVETKPKEEDFVL